MERSEIKAVIESLIFVSEEPVTIDLITMVLEECELKKKEIRELLEEIQKDYEENESRGIRIVEVAGGYQFRTKPTAADWIKKLNVPKPVRLSQPALETLSIVAYRQPIMRSEIENIRGVDTGGVLKTLLEKGLVRIVGKSDDVGHPLLYATTKEFLETFSLSSLKDLPTLKDVEDLEVRDRVGGLSRQEGDDVELNGVGQVVEEYKEMVSAYKPDPDKMAEDGRSIQNLEESVKRLRKLEKEIFPKPKEEIQAVRKEGEDALPEGAVAPEGTSAPTPEESPVDSAPETDETTTPQDPSRVD